MHRNPERIAWLILAASFTIFCLLVISIPVSIRWYIINSTEPLTTEVTSVRGTVLIDDPTTALSNSLVDGATTVAKEDFTISTNDTSQAILAFANESNLTMYSNTAIRLRQIHQPYFSLSPNPAQISIELKQGRLRATSSRSRQELNFNIYTPHAAIQLDQGSYSIEADDTESQITTRLGEATVTAQGKEVVLHQSERALVNRNSPPTQPLPAAKNLLQDSHFNPVFSEVWEPYVIDPLTGITPTVQVTTFQNHSVLLLKSEGADNIHSEVGIRQEVNKDVRDFKSLQVLAEVRLVRQSLPGGGHLGSEFPVMLHLAYKDANGDDRDWFHGFYYAPPPENYILYHQSDNSSERIPRYVWYPYESPNLLTTLGPAKPVFIKTVHIYASGWIYEAMVANISLLAEE